MAEIFDLSITDASNIARFPEGQAPSSLNNGARALEGIIARWFADTNGSVTAGGTADALTFAANQTFTAYFTGMRLTFTASAANTGAVTINVDSLGVKSIVKRGSTALSSDDIDSGAVYDIIYDGTDFQIMGMTGTA